MPRTARIVIPGLPHHVTQRGNHRQRVFFCDQDRYAYLLLQQRYLKEYQATVIGYSLMPNHIHDVLIPMFEDSLAKGVGLSTHDFAVMQNRKHKRTGHLWQARFYSNPIDEEDPWPTLRYVELNPMRAGLVKYPWEYPWSSARAHVTENDETGLLDMDLWRSRFTGAQWKEYLMQGINAKDEIERIQRAIRTGLPIGSESFIKKLEIITGRSLLPKGKK